MLTRLEHELLSRTPRWVRGLKSTSATLFNIYISSHPTMGAWIEILFSFTPNFNEASRTPRWVRGLKYVMWMYLL